MQFLYFSASVFTGLSEPPLDLHSNLPSFLPLPLIRHFPLFIALISALFFLLHSSSLLCSVNLLALPLYPPAVSFSYMSNLPSSFCYTFFSSIPPLTFLTFLYQCIIFHLLFFFSAEPILISSFVTLKTWLDISLQSSCSIFSVSFPTIYCIILLLLKTSCSCFSLFYFSSNPLLYRLCFLSLYTVSLLFYF